MFWEYQVTSTFLQSEFCSTITETHTLQNEYSFIASLRDNTVSAQQEESSQFYFYLELLTCISGTFIKTIREILSTAPLSVQNSTLEVTNSGPQTINMILSITKTSSSTTITILVSSSFTSTTSTDCSREVKISVRVAVLIFIIASLMLEIVLWWWCHRWSYSTPVHEGTMLYTQTLSSQD